MCTRYLTVWNDICGNSTKFGDPNCTESMDAGELIQEKGKVETLQLVLKEFTAKKRSSGELKGLISGLRRRGLIRRRVALARVARVKHNVAGAARIALFAIQISGRPD
ncbi:uncharacterized protein LOC116849074 isoform X1 [Odontomachus brunneus]|uniref:uncharacterized protein LOC116849074 isoform X1 n=1 Tax=Odontomachus brunneus TaxID=486640 RepID=UPI0013F27FAF|nr:uncharacterized protein LOC116849074 isoform X1 [Odontomachus brunneus]